MDHSLASEGMEQAWGQQGVTGCGGSSPKPTESGRQPRRRKAKGDTGTGGKRKRRAAVASGIDDVNEALATARAGGWTGRQLDAAGGPGPRCVACGGPARFKREGGNKFQHGYCGRHADTTMVDIRGPVCDYPGCTRPNAPVAKRATYALPGESKPRRCSSHRELGMVDVVHKKGDAIEPLELPSVEPPPKAPVKRVRGKGRRDKSLVNNSGGAVSAASSSASSASSSLLGSGGGGLSVSSKEGEQGAGGPWARSAQHKAKSSSLGSTASLLAAALSMGGTASGLEDGGGAGSEVLKRISLADALAHGSKAARCEALRQLAVGDVGSRQPPVSPSAVAMLLREPDTELRKLALDVLERLGPSGAEAIVGSGLLGDHCPEVRRWAVYGLGHVGPHARGHIDAVAPFLVGADSGARQWAVYALGRIGGLAARAALVPALEGLLRDVEAEVRCAALVAVRALDAEMPPELLPQQQLRLGQQCLAGPVALLVHDPEPKVQLAALATLASYGERAAPYAESLALLLGSPVWELAHAAEEALPSMGPTVGGHLVRLGLLTHPRKEVRCTALRVLGELGVGAWPHVEWMRERLRDADEAVRLSAAIALARLVQSPGPSGEAAARCLDDLSRLLLADPSLEVRARALSGFLGIGARARPYVGTVARMLVEDPEPFARSVALDTLCCLGELALPYMDCVVKVLREDPEQLVVSRAVYHLSTGVFRDELPAFARDIATALVEVLRDGRVDQSQLDMANSLLAFCINHLTSKAAHGGQQQEQQIPSSEAASMHQR
jgi:HEAT repeat protein